MFLYKIEKIGMDQFLRLPRRLGSLVSVGQ
jgi:hypothetical protein